MYFPMPSVTQSARLERLPVLDASTVIVSPAEAAAKLGVDLDDLRLSSFDGRPAYRAGGRGGGPVLYADTGEEQGDVSTEMVQRVAVGVDGTARQRAHRLKRSLKSISGRFRHGWARSVLCSSTRGRTASRSTSRRRRVKSCSTRRRRRASARISAPSRTGSISRLSASTDCSGAAS